MERRVQITKAAFKYCNPTDCPQPSATLAFTKGAEWADEHPKDNLDINFPKYDNIVDKVFGAGNLECWEYDQAKQLVKLAKDELLLELKAQQNNLIDIDKACDTIKDLLGGYVIRNFHFGDSYDMDKLIDDFIKETKGE